MTQILNSEEGSVTTKEASPSTLVFLQYFKVPEDWEGQLSFCGNAGSGKSILGEVASRYLPGIVYYDMGDVFRQMADKKGMSLLDFSKFCLDNEEADKEVDAYQVEIAKRERRLLMVGRTSWHFIPDSFKVFLKCNRFVGAKRIYEDKKKRNESKPQRTIGEIATDSAIREDNEYVRYIDRYGINIYDLDNYDLVIDTDELHPLEVIEKVLRAFVEFMNMKKTLAETSIKLS